MSTNICAPNRYDSKNKTCFSLEQLIEMAKAYNRHLSKNKLNPSENVNKKLQSDLITIKPAKTYLFSELMKRFNDVCGSDEVCLTKQLFMIEVVDEMREEILFGTFRGEGPEKYNEWLSTKDIDQIMKPYEKKYPEFIFFGAVPLNCNEVSFCSLYKLDFNDCIKRKKYVSGIIFNHDKYGEPGSHWVALYIDIKDGKVYFCDSNGKPPIDNIIHIINSFTKYYNNKTGKNVLYKYNTIPYQKDGSECGVYSCNFLIRILSGESFDVIVKNSLAFKEINSCRNVYFRNKPSKYLAHEKCDP